MPLEIRELHIKAVIENPSEGSNVSSENTTGDDGNERLIKACVEKVMELIKEAKER